jgi:glycosyltransferase involved in cell wall biosynthesis
VTLLTVVFPVYNGEKYLYRSIVSLFQQSFRDFILLILDDGSTDRTSDIIHAFHDDRIQMVRNNSNLGLVATLNIGLSLVTTKYVAMMHADDIAFPDRFLSQVEFLARHPEIDIVGTSYFRVDQRGNYIDVVFPPEGDLEIRWVSFLASPFGHSTVMIRTSALEKLSSMGPIYRQEFDVGIEDYDLWIRLLGNSRGANLPEPLLAYRVHQFSNSERFIQVSSQYCTKITRRMLKSQLPGIELSDQAICDLRELFHGSGKATFPEERIVQLVQDYYKILDEFLAIGHVENRDAARLKALEASRIAWLIRTCPGLIKYSEITQALMKSFPGFIREKSGLWWKYRKAKWLWITKYQGLL